MFNLFKRKKLKTVLVAIHGFGRRRTDELLPLKNFFIDTDIEIVMPELFNPHNAQDTNFKEWIKRAEDAVDSLLQREVDVVLVGFSMGGVIASHLAACKPIKKLILLAPAFSYINVANATDLITGIFSGKKEDNKVYPPLPSDFTSVFMNVVDSLKQDITLVDFPVLLFHGTEDETISVASSRKIFKKIPSTEKAMILLEGVNHRILDDPRYSSFVLHNIQLMIQNQIHF